jgi:4-amino-4-deoxy-L-arabinose transferase-like glycosyltransferase
MMRIKHIMVSIKPSIDTVGGALQRFLAPITHREEFSLCILVLVSILIRLIVMFYFHTYQFPNEKSMGAEMGWIARNLANGEGFKVGIYYAWMAPLYPFLLSLIFHFFGSYTLTSVLIILIMQSVFSSLIVIPFYLIGRKLFNRRVGVIAALLWVFYPSAIYYSIRFVWSSSLTALGISLIILLFLNLSEMPLSTINSTFCGLVVGLTALSDPVILIFIPFAALWLLWRSKNNLKSAVIHILLLGVTSAVLLTPWIIRNYRIFNQFVPIKSTFGVNLWQGNFGPDINQPTAGIGFGDVVEKVFTEKEVNYLLSLNEVERADFFRDKAMDFIMDSPEVFTKYTFQRIYLFWRLNVFPLKATVLIPFYLAVLIGFLASKRRWPDSILLLLLFATFPIPYYLTIADTPRYRFPIEGLLLVFAAYTVSLFTDFVVLAINRYQKRSSQVEYPT